MTTKFPDIPVYQGYYMPSRMEVDIADLEVMHGEIPKEINGTFYRVGPDPQFPPLLGTDLRFNGDGMVSMFRFSEGHVDYKSRWVHTDKFKLERAARRALFGAYRNPFTDDASVKGKIRGTANTNVLFHAGQLFAYKEDSPPMALDPHTLATVGYSNYAGKLTSETFTAHAKIDPVNGDMLGFGYAAKGVCTTDIAYYVIDTNGTIKHEAWFEAPYAGMVHDWVVTQDYVIFPIVPISSDLERSRAGKPAFMWDESKDVYLGVLPRLGSAKDIRWFRGPTRFAAHFLNGFNEGGKIHLDGIVAAGNLFPFFPDVNGKPFDVEKSLARLTRWTIDLSQDDGFVETTLTDFAGCEFPKIDERFATLPYKHGFLAIQDPKNPFINGRYAFPHLGHFEFETGLTTRVFAGPNRSFQEPVFVPRHAGAPEADGYLVVLRNDLVELTTELLILDVQRLAAEPVAVIRLPMRLRDAIHGSWVDADELPSPNQ
ncbi:lignostilbene alpha-beta-dioxygenase [Duganella sp. FT94W]|uniref:Lignostilbene alpha-beta-dioxygenase n=1 Tax=Duganella lactea TaxID=2692173 RepID=A0ABW9V3T5_9BURK|nr:carotenoid oxygenase family protein [Duganella lactea]MYM34364.1 lignostilbene alpha-beta-dioxygenase [Duganella lactea]